ncbi:MAG TPA: DUF4340 domain-containing protein [Kiritimatiellia bacterium]|nr:DUF4340 domain-containing protein [Kiritimatiellia bacterium]
MTIRFTGLLALVAAVLGLLIAFWDRDDDTARARLEEARRAFRFNPARVDRLFIEAGELAIECRLRGRQWHLVRPISARADSIAIERLLAALQELPRGDIILPPRRATDAYVPYGLDTPRARISIIEAGVTNEILIGRRTPLGDGVYVRQSHHAGLARIHPSLLDLLPAGAEALRDRTLLAGAPAAIERLDIRSPAGYVQLARNGNGEWRMFQPLAGRADSAAVGAILENLLACTVVQFIHDGVSDLAPYGLDGPGAVTAVLNTDTGDGSQMLSFGDPLPNDPALVYARLQAENSIYAVPLAVRQALLVRPDDLRDRRVPGLEPAAMVRVRIDEAEHALEFHRETNGTWQLVAPMRAPAESAAIEALLHSWAEVRLTSFELLSPTSPPPVFPRRLRIETRNAQSPPIEFRLGPHPQDPNSVRLLLENDSAIAIASPPVLLTTPLDPLRYRSRDILSIPVDDIASLQMAMAGQTAVIARDPLTGQWSPAEVWVEPLVTAFAALRADDLLSDQGLRGTEASFSPPFLTVTATLRGQSGLAVVLLVGDETSPGGPRSATIRGRDLVFTLAPDVVLALWPPILPETP